MQYEKDIEEFQIKIKRSEKLIFLAKFFRSKKMILTALEESASANKILMISILKFNHIKGNVKLSENAEKNKQILHEQIGNHWEMQHLLDNTEKLMILHKKHKSSPMEFMKRGKVIILDENNNIETITLEKLRDFLISIKEIKQIFKNQIYQ
ncbi:MAG: hypothetical protein PF542_04160 [Nanoarchaeota archaeon]|jgi:hypothetical protein|nr:hypothetical protein [Nanoarchaeota archaeon]